MNNVKCRVAGREKILERSYSFCCCYCLVCSYVFAEHSHTIQHGTSSRCVNAHWADYEVSRNLNAHGALERVMHAKHVARVCPKNSL